MKKVVRRVRKKFDGVETAAFNEGPWDNKVSFFGVCFKKDHDPDLNLWKKTNRNLLYKGRLCSVYVSRRKTKEQKAHAEVVREALPSEKFFQDEKVLKLLHYDPKKKVSDITANRILITTFRPGWSIDKGKATYIFKAYPEYEPPRGVKEMLISEYNKLMGET